MLAKRLPTILPPLSFDEALEATKLYSIAGLLHDDQALLAPPLPCLHHSLFNAGLIGGGSVPRPADLLPRIGLTPRWERAGSHRPGRSASSSSQVSFPRMALVLQRRDGRSYRLST
jgi:hypothetical protein